MKFLLGQPKHGWVDIILADNGFRLRESVSDVPNDFIDDTMVAISRLVTYENTQHVELSLEPGFLIMVLIRQANRYSVNFKSSEMTSDEILFQCEGSLADIVLPIYRAIKGFYNLRKLDTHWPEINQTNFQSMVDAVSQSRNR